MSKNVIINLIIAVLCLATIAMLLIPSFSFVNAKEEEISENFMGYATFPNKHKDFGKYLKAEFETRWNVEYYINDTIHGIVLLFLLSVASFILCVVFRDKIGSAIICGFLSVLYLSVAIQNKMLILSSFRWFFLIVAVLVFVLEVASVYFFYKRAKARAAERAKEEIIL